MAFLVTAGGICGYLKRYRSLFTWARLGNFLLVLASLAMTRVLRRPVVWGRPFMLMVEPTNLCNLRCPLCPSGNGEMSRARGKMRVEDFKRLVDATGRHVFMMMLWNQGEPYLNEGFNEMVRYAHQRGIFTFTSTNGHFIRDDDAAPAVVESGLDELIVSVDGVDQETYARYRVGGSLDVVFDGIRRVLRARAEASSRTPVVNLQFIVMRHNESQMEMAERLAEDLGVDKFLVKTAQIYTAADAEAFLPRDTAYVRYEQGAGAGLQVKGQPARGCKVLWYSSTVNWDGRVAPCCFDKDVDFCLGQAFADRPFDRIWWGSEYRDFRKRVLADRRSIPMCCNCSEGYRGMFSLVRQLEGREGGVREA